MIIMRGKLWSRVFFGFLFSLGISLFGFLLWYVSFEKITLALTRLSWVQSLAVASFVLVVLFIAAWRWQVILRGYGYEMRATKLLGLVFRSATISLIFPSFEISGETFKAFRLRKQEVSTPAAFASVFFDFFMVLATNTTTGAVLLIYMISQSPRGSLFIWSIAGLILVILSLSFILKKFFERGWFSRLIVQSSPVMHYVDDKTLEDVKLFDFGISFFIKESKRYLLGGFLISFLGFIWELAQIYLGLYFLGYAPSFFSVIVFYLAINFFNSMPVFGGFGFGEAGAFLAGMSLGIPDTTSLSLSLILRLKQVVILLVGALLFAKDGLQAFLKSSRR